MAKPEDIEQFQLILHNRATKPLLTIYTGDKNAKLLNQSCIYTANDIISAVNTNLKAIQIADCVKSNKNRIKLSKYKRNSLLPVNSLSIQNEEPKPATSSKFETQCMSDTQLIDVIDKAEALMQLDTQEFDTSFCCNLENKSHNIKKVDKVINCSNNACPENLQTNYDGTGQIEKDVIYEKEVMLSPDILEMVEEDTNSSMIADDKQIITENVNIKISKTRTSNVSMDLETNPDNLCIVFEEIKQPSSPILNTIKQVKDPSRHLVYNLDDFEKFEKVAFTLLFTEPDINFDKEKLNRQLITSECELTLKKENESPCSPILKRNMKNIEKTKTRATLIESLGIHSKETNFTNIDAQPNKCLNIKQNFNLEYKIPMLEDNLLNDEIIFSSDEENDYVHNDFQELPMTCALETSFYNNKSGILDETIFVGFQTASNKSIQISVDSFEKAQEVFNNLDNKITGKIAMSINELVEQCDSFPKSNVRENEGVKIGGQNANNENKLMTISDSNISTSERNVTITNSDHVVKHMVPCDNSIKMTNDINNVESFRIANNKSIPLCHKSLSKVQKVFPDMELDKAFAIDSLNLNKNPVIEEIDIVFSANGFKTACNNNKYFTHDASEKNIFENQDNTYEHQIIIDNIANNNIQNTKHIMEQAKHPTFKGFNTASDKKIFVSEEALAITKKVFKNIDLSGQPAIENEDNVFFEEFNDELSYVLENVDAKCQKRDIFNSSHEKIRSKFKSTTNKSNEAMCDKNISIADTRSTDIFPEHKSETKNKAAKIKNVCISEDGLCKTKLVPGTDSNIWYLPFKTASNNDVPTIKEVLNKSNNDIKELANINISRNFGETVVEERSKGLSSFQTASNKKISISDKALAKTKKVFEDIELNEINNAIETTKTTNFIGFQTTSDNKKSISEGALEKTKEVSRDIDLSQQIVQTDDAANKMLNFIGFQTPSNKHVNKSEFTIVKRKKVLEEFTKCTQQKLNNGEEKSKTRNYDGFQTASNKKVTISEEALAKAKNVFEDIQLTQQNQQINNETTKLSNFVAIQMVSDKKRTTSDKALAKTKKLFEDIALNENKNPCNNIETTKITHFVGFQTASDKKVSVSEVALAKTKEVFSDIELSQQNVQKDDATNKMVNFVGFQTATNKKVNMSEGTITKSKKIFEEFTKFAQPKLKQGEEIRKTTNIVGFQTANNKTVTISEDALTKAKNVFGDIELSQQTLQKYEETTKTANFIGFHTARNEKVKISEDALAKCKKIFEDIEFTQPSLMKVPEISKRTTFVGFQTASNKKVCISEDALAKSKKVFKDIELSQQNVQKEDAITNITNFVGFQTASNKKVCISEDALTKSKKVFKDIELSQQILQKDDEITKITNFDRLQTATNKIVNFSEDALLKSKKLFEDIEFSKPKLRKIEETGSTTNFVGYKTGSNKKVDVSEEELVKTTTVFKDELNVDCEANKTRSFLCFNTANNKKVSLSETALADTKNIFKNVEHSYQIQVNKDRLLDNKVTEKLKTNDVDVTAYINTQVLNNFDESLNTEDFLKSPKAVKRSKSPILSCPKAKKRKIFQTPYKLKSVIATPNNIPAIVKKSKDTFIFNEHYKKTKILKLKDIDLLEKTTKSESKIDPCILNFKFDNLLEIEFDKERNDISNKKFTVEDLKRIFLENVDRKIVPDNWIDNHLKLILWKLLSYEIRFANTMDNICSAKTVMEQLKWRYNRELCKVERPALRKILEKDDLPSRTIVLCVVSIFQDGKNVNSVTSISNNVELLLTDGWYCVKASIDSMLSRLVFDGKIKIGSKIVTCGAELMNCDQGVSPWEDTSKVRLKLFGNSTRRALWDARLGYHGNAAILANLSTVKVDGGKVSKTKLFVTKVYPLLYVEKFEDGSTVTRSERLEQIYQMKYDTQRQMLIEKIYEEIEKEFSDQSSQDSDTTSIIRPSCKRSCMETGSQIAKMMKRSRDPAEFRSHLTASQNESLQDYNTKQREKLLLNIQDKMQERISKTNLSYTRNVVTLLKLRVSGVQEKNGGLEVTKGMMSLWKPSDAILDLMKEGTWVDVLNIVPTSVRCSEIHLSAGRQSSFNRAKIKITPKIEAYAKNIARNCTSIKNLLQIPNQNSDYNEIDTIGLIFLIDPSNIEFEKESNKNQHFQNVYFTDQDKNIICVNFWGGIKKFGFENIIDVGQIVACVNLQKRIGNTRKNIPQYRVTEFTYFTKTPKNVNARTMIEDLVKQFNGVDRRKFCKDCVDLKNNFNVIKYQNNHHDNISPCRFSTTDYNLSKNKIFIDSPLAQKTKKELDDMNLTGLDFESTFKQKETQDMSPEVLKRKQLVKEKIARLKMYGEPPPLCPIYITNKSKSASNSYKSPLISNNNTNLQAVNPNTTPKSTITKKENSVASISENDSGTGIQKENWSSPVIPFNRTCVNRSSVNPVKLNFSNSVSLNENNEAVDHFAEEFESSPPLSLD